MAYLYRVQKQWTMVYLDHSIIEERSTQPTIIEHNSTSQGHVQSVQAMRTSISVVGGVAVATVVCCSSCASAFVVPGTVTRVAAQHNAGATAADRIQQLGTASRSVAGPLAAEKEGEGKGEEDQEPMDLDLEQMFEVSITLQSTGAWSMLNPTPAVYNSRTRQLSHVVMFRWETFGDRMYTCILGV